MSLNPYSIGIWSATDLYVLPLIRCNEVLILILLEYGLRHFRDNWVQLCKVGVLILILLEYGLRRKYVSPKNTETCLNPYSIGIWSATPKIANH